MPTSAEPASGLRGSCKRKRTPRLRSVLVRYHHHESIVEASSIPTLSQLTSHHLPSAQRHSYFYTVLTTPESPSTTRLRLLFPDTHLVCLAARSHMHCLASSLLRRFHKRVTVFAALGCDSEGNLASCILPDNVSVLDLELRLSGS
jgi:hypothetical protein